MRRKIFVALWVSILFSSAYPVQPVLYPGWPPKAIFFPDVPEISGWLPEVVNLDTFPDMEIAAAFAFDSLYVWKPDASILPPWPLNNEPGFYYWSSFSACGDVDGDKKVEIVFATAMDPLYSPIKVHILRGDKSQLEGWPIQIPVWRQPNPVLADLNFDGKLEIILSPILDTLVYIYDYRGRPYPGWPQKIIYDRDYGNLSAILPAVGDLDRDGTLEIVAHTWNRLYAWHSDGRPVDGFPIETVLADYPARSYFYPNPVLADLNRDGKLEIIVDGYYYWGPGVDTFTSFLTAYDWRGKTLPGFPRIFDSWLNPAPCVGDIDQDGYPEIAVMHMDSYQFPNVYLIRHDGTDQPGWPILQDGTAWHQIAMADVDGDGWTDLVSMNNYLLKSLGRIFAYKKDGTLVEGFPFNIYGFTTPHTPAFADVNHDGFLDMAIITDHPADYSWTTSYYYTYLFKLPGVPYDPTTLLWPQFGHDDYNTNNTEWRISYKIGDPSADNRINIVDIVYLVNFVFRKRLIPNPLWNSDVNCDGQVNLSDVMELAYYVFKGRTLPCH